MADNREPFEADTFHEVPRFVAYLQEQMDAEGLVLVPKSILSEEQLKRVRQLKVTTSED